MSVGWVGDDFDVAVEVEEGFCGVIRAIPGLLNPLRQEEGINGGPMRRRAGKLGCTYQISSTQERRSDFLLLFWLLLVTSAVDAGRTGAPRGNTSEKGS